MIKKISFLFLLVFSVSFVAYAQETGQKKYGVVYNIAEDRKVEKIGGIYEPEGLDKYVKRRFDQVDQRLNDLENQINQLKLELLEAIKEISKKKKSILVS